MQGGSWKLWGSSWVERCNQQAEASRGQLTGWVRQAALSA